MNPDVPSEDEGAAAPDCTDVHWQPTSLHCCFKLKNISSFSIQSNTFFVTVINNIMQKRELNPQHSHSQSIDPYVGSDHYKPWASVLNNRNQAALSPGATPSVCAYCCSTGRVLQELLKFSSNCNISMC